MIKINKQQFDFKLTNVKHLQKFYDEIAIADEALKKAQTKIDGAENPKALIDAMTDQCNAVFAFFDSVLGENAANKIFGDETDIEQCANAYYDFIDEMNKTAKEFGDRSEKRMAKYQPVKKKR